MTNESNDRGISVSFVEKDHNLSSIIEFALVHTNHKDITFANAKDLWNALSTSNMQLIAFNNKDEVDNEAHFKKVKIAKKISLSYKKRRVKVNGEDIKLTKQEFEILGLLYDYRGQVVSRELILEHIWGISYTNSNIVAVSVTNIRRKLGQFAKIIETVRGVGYILYD